MLWTVSITIIATLLMTFLTAPEPDATLDAFYKHVRPRGPGWGPIAARTGVLPASAPLTRQLTNWVLGCGLIYAWLFGIGEVLLFSVMKGVVMLAIGAVAGLLLVRNIETEGD
jgi:hypothetical protein